MNFFKVSQLLCLFALSAQTLYADSPKKKAQAFESHRTEKRNYCQKCNLGTVGFSVTNPEEWYTIETPSYPDTVLLSKNANRGSKQGKVRLKDTGLKISEPGNYSVTFTAILLNNNPFYTALIPVFVAINDEFGPNSTTTLGNVVSLQAGIINTVQATGILENVDENTTLSLVATNGGSSEPQEITVVGWSISVFKIPCESKR